MKIQKVEQKFPEQNFLDIQNNIIRIVLFKYKHLNLMRKKLN